MMTELLPRLTPVVAADEMGELYLRTTFPRPPLAGTFNDTGLFPVMYAETASLQHAVRRILRHGPLSLTQSECLARSTFTAVGDEAVLCRRAEEAFWDLLLASEWPMHVAPVPWLLKHVVTLIARGLKQSLLEHRIPGGWIKHIRNGRSPSKEWLLGYWPRKSHPLAGKKANLFLDCVIADFLQNYKCLGPVLEGWMKRTHLLGIYEDQACNIIVYAQAVMLEFGFEESLYLATWAVLRAKQAKALSDVLKAMGQNMCAVGRHLCELAVLQGRGVNRLDLLEDAERRVSATFNCPIVHVPADALRQCVRDVLRRELRTRVVLPPSDDFFRRRYAWCVGGAHNLNGNDHWLPRSLLPQFPAALLWNRRAALNCVERNPLKRWSGHVRVSVAEKVEQGKGRAIYSCDTLSYTAFSWLLEAVEKEWASRSVILNPGKGGTLGMMNRIRGAATGGRRQCYLMLDYSDFNSQHSNEAMRIVIEETLACCDHNEPELAAKLLKSIDDMHIYLRGVHIGRVAGSLMSGHRATTYWNSVLNAAYVRYAIGRVAYDTYKPFHVGDDVLILLDSPADAWNVVKKLEHIGCTLQRSKQSVGIGGYEFLRVAGSPFTGVGGYVARSVAGLVSGSWVSSVKMAPREALQSLIQQARSIMNRSGNPAAYKLLISSARRTIGIDQQYLEEFLSGNVALAPGPCYRSDRRYVARHVEWESSADDPYGGGRLLIGGIEIEKLPNHAARDYVNWAASEVERVGLAMVGRVPWRAMALTAYAAMEPSLYGNPSGGVRAAYISPRTVRLIDHYIDAADITTTDSQHGILAQYPLLSLLRNYFSMEDLTYLLNFVGRDAGIDARVTAWGGTNEGICVCGLLPYADAAGAASRVLGNAIHVSVPVAV
ncbi:RNA-dependent RNA polymerase [Eimeria brunetti RNA virus 1]|uniref:RNA-dependent RNA polymerase n=1 Tax=Eimeria brunetti RNA virus 1 TaxID=155414 RepID=UPI00000ED9B2|nr:RNA-dependent RNA polymerase [Eimeria brunetti RNA virus 1]AAK26438.1 RNA-dependent RNA polymerase [Eimeria brunetti RNA virus 1]